MELSDFANGMTWAIRKATLEDMIAHLTAGAEDVRKKFNLPNHEATLFSENPERGQMEIRDGIAIIPIYGPISKRGSFLSMFFGGTNLVALTVAMQEARINTGVQGIVLDIDSPGGTVAGTEAFGDLIWEIAREKPIVSFANGMMASAAYWIGSAAGGGIVVENAAIVGSIGTIMTHHDWSGNDEQIGLKRTILTAGTYKAVGNDAEPLSDLSRETLQGQLDYIYTLFVNTVARNLNVEPELVLNDMADGRDFLGQQAVDVGLADETGNIDRAIEIAGSLVPSRSKAQPISIPGAGASNQNGGKIMKNTITKPENVEQLTIALPDLVAAIEATAVAGVDIKGPAAVLVLAETDRVLALVGAQFGAEAGAKFKAVIESGVSIEQLTAIKALEPEVDDDALTGQAAIDAASEKMLAKIKAAGVAGLGLDSSAGGGGKGFLAQVEEHLAANKGSRTDAIKAVIKKDPAAHAAYLKEMQTAA